MHVVTPRDALPAQAVRRRDVDISQPVAHVLEKRLQGETILPAVSCLTTPRDGPQRQSLGQRRTVVHSPPTVAAGVPSARYGGSSSSTSHAWAETPKRTRSSSVRLSKHPEQERGRQHDHRRSVSRARAASGSSTSRLLRASDSSGAGPSAAVASTRRVESAVRVVVRLRPLSASSQDEAVVNRSDGSLQASAVVFMAGPGGRSVISHNESYVFDVDHVFPSEATQSEVYEDVGCPIVADVLAGYNGTILAYGQTGSGKTHSMFGSDLSSAECQGLVPRAAEQLCEATVKMGEQALDPVTDDGPVECSLRCSMLELYCEQLRDLLEPARRELRIQEAPNGGVFVDGLCERPVTCQYDLLEILRTGGRTRTVACTKLNGRSSRSHVLFFITCEQRLRSGGVKVGKLSLVDLAGSENIGKSGALSLGGLPLKEAKMINWSLSALGLAIQALSEQRPHVPFRNSQLTRVLQETLGGNCKTTLLVTCSPEARFAGETISSLRFATRARAVRKWVSKNVVAASEAADTCSLTTRLQQQLAAAHKEAQRLGIQLPPECYRAHYSWSSDFLDTSPKDRLLSSGGSEDATPRASGSNFDEGYSAFEGSIATLLAQEAAASKLQAELESLLPDAGSEARRALEVASRVFRGRLAEQTSLWQGALRRHEVAVTSAAAAEAEATACRLEEELAATLDRLRSARRLARRGEARLAPEAWLDEAASPEAKPGSAGSPGHGSQQQASAGSSSPRDSLRGVRSPRASSAAVLEATTRSAATQEELLAKRKAFDDVFQRRDDENKAFKKEVLEHFRSLQASRLNISKKNEDLRAEIEHVSASLESLEAEEQAMELAVLSAKRQGDVLQARLELLSREAKAAPTEDTADFEKELEAAVCELTTAARRKQRQEACQYERGTRQPLASFSRQTVEVLTSAQAVNKENQPPPSRFSSTSLTNTEAGSDATTLPLMDSCIAKKLAADVARRLEMEVSRSSLEVMCSPGFPA
eukprot:TRINITY_DN41458_c0_g1_i2.p1 TRINITY_DN41458_c0_g1~~TRINITY_DN41458_c0_g1_i2.p1  ORF type:complete len:990 (+),score=217.14 TRINITY_DN41458_c0_g1_i2:39-3008(+)